MIDKIILHVSDETSEFYDDLNIEQTRLKLFVNFNSDIKHIDSVETPNITIGEPKEKFKPIVKQYQKIDSSKSIF